MNSSHPASLRGILVFSTALTAIALLAGCGGPTPPADEAVRKAVETTLLGRTTGTFRKDNKDTDLESFRRTGGVAHKESDGLHYRAEGTATLYTAMPVAVTHGDGDASGGQPYDLDVGDALAYTFTVDFRRDEHDWVVQSVECHAPHELKSREQETEAVNAILAALKDPKFTWSTQSNRPFFQSQPKYNGQDLETASTDVRKTFGKAIVDYFARQNDRIGFLSYSAGFVERWLPASEGLTADASKSEQEKVLREYAKSHPDTLLGKHIAQNLEEKRKEREARAVKRRTHDGVLSDAQSLASAFKDYIRTKNLGPDSPMTWALLSKVHGGLDLEEIVPDGKDGLGHPFLIGPTAADGICVHPDTITALAKEVPTDRDFWGVFSPNPSRDTKSVIDDAQNISIAITNTVKEKSLDDDDPLTWDSIRDSLFKSAPETPSLRSRGKDGFGRPYDLGPTVGDGLHFAPETFKALMANPGDSGMYIEYYDPRKSTHPPDGVVEPTTRTIDRARLRLDPSLLDSDYYVDLWARIYEEGRFKRDFNNEFAWGSVRQKIREKLRAALPTFPTSFRLRFAARLDKYDTTAGAFRVLGIDRMPLIRVSVARSFNFFNEAATTYMNFPGNIDFTFTTPLTLATLPCPPDKAQALVERMLAHNNASREIECVALVRAADVPTKPSAGQMNIAFPVRLESVALIDGSRVSSNDPGGQPQPFYTLAVSQEAAAPAATPTPHVVDEFHPQPSPAITVAQTMTAKRAAAAPPVAAPPMVSATPTADADSPVAPVAAAPAAPSALVTAAPASATPITAAPTPALFDPAPAADPKAEAKAADKDLNAAYRPLLERLRKTGDPSIAKNFIAAQTQWLAARDRITDPVQQLVFVRARVNQFRQLAVSFDQQMKAFDDAHKRR